MKNSERTAGGFTLLELLVAITITGIVVTLGFAFYLNFTALFTRQGQTAARLCNTVIVQKRIERVCNGFLRIDRCTENEVSGIAASTGCSRNIRYSGTALIDNDHDTVATNLCMFRFTLTKNRADSFDRNAVLLWEGTLVGNEWVGGAAAAFAAR